MRMNNAARHSGFKFWIQFASKRRYAWQSANPYIDVDGNYDQTMCTAICDKNSEVIYIDLDDNCGLVAYKAYC